MADAALASVLAFGAVAFHLFSRHSGGAEPVGEASVLGVVFSLAGTLPLVWRRQRPIIVLLVVLAAQIALELETASGPTWLALVIAAYTLGAHCSGRQVWWVGGATTVGSTGFVLLGWATDEAALGDAISTGVSFALALVVGDNIRRRRERAADLVERAERAERERELVADRQVHDERNRIARELHDIVAHSVSVMVIQAGAARRQLAADPELATRALLTIEDTGRQAMREMRRVLGVLRDEAGPTTDSAGRAPLPSLAALEDLVAESVDLPVALSTTGDLADLPPGVELSAYRIVQEALTNVRRHAGRVERVDVCIARVTGALTVEVVDDGRGASVTTAGSGFGLVGMRERVGMFAGELVAGPATGGGWRVRATFPIDTTVSAPLSTA